jgi:hypothetical protein
MVVGEELETGKYATRMGNQSQEKEEVEVGHSIAAQNSLLNPFTSYLPPEP